MFVFKIHYVYFGDLTDFTQAVTVVAPNPDAALKLLGASSKRYHVDRVENICAVHYITPDAKKLMTIERFG